MQAHLSQQTVEIVRATVPALEAHGLTITRAMYDRLALSPIQFWPMRAI
jgi:nitric oxide dioxygenase